MPSVNLFFCNHGKVWKNVVGDMARHVVNNAPDDLTIFFGKTESEGDVVHYFDIGPAKLGRRSGIMGVHQISPRQAGRKIDDLASALKRHRHAVVLTPNMKSQVLPYQSNVTVIPGGVSEALKPCAIDKTRTRPARVTLGACGFNRGSNGDVKGAALLTQVLHRLPTFRYRIAGSGWDETVREGARLGADVSQQIYDSDQLAAFYRGLDVFLCTSREEGGGLPILEALTAGVPVVSTSVGYANVLRDADNPYIQALPFVGHPNESDHLANPLAFQDAISAELAKQAAMTDEELQRYREQISDSVSQYTWDAYCAAHYVLYREELERGV